MAPKRPRSAAPAAAPVHTGRVTLDVGGTRFVSSRSTLEGASSYFRSLLVRWSPATPDDPIFLDCDADAFGVLLSHMRVPSCVLLPPGDVGLATRVLLLAEYLGLDGFLTAIKARAYAHMHSCSTATDAAAATAFDEEVGGLQQAIEKRLLPARFFAPEPPPPPPPPEATVQTLIPAAGFTAIFADDEIDLDDDLPQVHSVHRVVSLALVQLADGSREVDALIQPNNNELEPRGGERTRSQLVLASEHARDVPWVHWVLSPARLPSLLSIAPGTVRGRWVKPAFEQADLGRAIEIADGVVTVGGVRRHVDWEGEVQGDLAGTIHTVTSECRGDVIVRREREARGPEKDSCIPTSARADTHSTLYSRAVVRALLVVTQRSACTTRYRTPAPDGGAFTQKHNPGPKIARAQTVERGEAATTVGRQQWVPERRLRGRPL